MEAWKAAPTAPLIDSGGIARVAVLILIWRCYVAGESLLLRHGTVVTPGENIDLPQLLSPFFTASKVGFYYSAMIWTAPSEKDNNNARWKSASGTPDRSAKSEFRSPISSSFDIPHSTFARSAAEARFDYLLNRPEAENIGAKVNATMCDIEAYHGRILDPVCGSGGMFVSSARFVSENKKNPAAEFSRN